MFVGHYAAALAIKAVQPKTPLWTLAAGCQLIDIGWSGLIAAGVERVRIDPSLAGSTLVLEHMPWTHSLPAVLVWSLAAAVVVHLLLRLSVWSSVLVGACVFSHWILDLLVHRPDLELWIGGDKVGLGLWNYPVLEQAIELGLFATAGAFWAARRKGLGGSTWPAVAFIAFLACMQIVGVLATPPNDAAQIGLSALVLYIVITAVAALTDWRGPKPTSLTYVAPKQEA